MAEAFNIELTKEEKAAGVEIIQTASPEIVGDNITDKKVEAMARSFIMGSRSNVRRRDVQEKLEERVVKKIGRKGKYLVDKLFELIEGVYVIDKRGRVTRDKNGEEKVESIRYYQVPPSLNAIIYALDRVLGKPTVRSESVEEKKGLILVEHVIKNLANNPYKNEKRVGENIIKEESVKDKGGGSGSEHGAPAGCVHEGSGEGAV